MPITRRMASSSRSLRRSSPPRRALPIDRAYLALGNRLGDSLEREMIAAASLAPRVTRALVAAAVIAGAMFMLAGVLIVGGVAVIVLGRHEIVEIVIGAMAVAAGLVSFPWPLHRGKLPAGLTAHQAPHLHALIGRVADALQVEVPDAVVLDLRFNASWGTVGLRRRRVLRLGVPLLASLDTPAVVALLGHELAHECNGDSRRHPAIASSLESIASVIEMLRPQPVPRRHNRVALEMYLTNGALWVARQPFVGLLALQTHLLYRDSQRAEYLADDLSAEVAGTDAAVGVQDALLSSVSTEVVIRRATLNDDRTGATLLREIRTAALSLDVGTREQRWQVARTEGHRLDGTHPPTASRIAVLRGRPHRDGAVRLDPDRAAALTDELQRLMAPYAAKLIDLDRDRLYFR